MPRFAPRGRSFTTQARDAVVAAVASIELRRDLLIEHLHALQDRYGCLREGHLLALAAMLRLAPVEVFEVATFYAHFDVLEDAAPEPEPVTVRVCESLPCAMAGAARLMQALRDSPLAGVRLVAAPCMGACHHAPACAVGLDLVEAATPERVARALAGDTLQMPVPPTLADYRARGGYRVLAAALAGDLPRDLMLARIGEAGLRGLGGAGFPAARKWALVRANPGPRHVVVNADEGEPGTFKDRYCLETEPHRVLEGMLLAAHAVQAETCWIYLRDEYPHLRRALERAIADLAHEGLVERHIRQRVMCRSDGSDDGCAGKGRRIGPLTAGLHVRELKAKARNASLDETNRDRLHEGVMHPCTRPMRHDEGRHRLRRHLQKGGHAVSVVNLNLHGF